MLENYKEIPVIGKVAKINDNETFEIEYYKGSLKKAWNPWMVSKGRRRVPWCDTLPKSCIVLFAFTFRKDKKLRECSLLI